MDVLKIIDISQPALAEQVIEVPKINLQDTIPQRSVLGVPQLAEQLVEVPTVVSQSFFQEHFVKQNVPWCVGWWRPSRLTGFNSTSWYDYSWFDCDCWYVFSRTAPRGGSTAPPRGRRFAGQVFLVPDAAGRGGFIQSLTAQAELNSGVTFGSPRLTRGALPRVMSCGSPLGNCPPTCGKLLTWWSCKACVAWHPLTPSWVPPAGLSSTSPLSLTILGRGLCSARSWLSVGQWIHVHRQV